MASARTAPKLALVLLTTYFSMSVGAHSQTPSLLRPEHDKFSKTLTDQIENRDSQTRKEAIERALRAEMQLMGYYMNYISIKGCLGAGTTSEDKDTLDVVRKFVKQLEDKMRKDHDLINPDEAWKEASGFSSVEALSFLLPEGKRNEALSYLKSKNLDDQQKLVCAFHNERLVEGLKEHGIVDGPSKTSEKKDS